MNMRNSQKFPPECQEFFILFRRHWDNGSGLKEHDFLKNQNTPAWELGIFCQAMKETSIKSVSEKTVRSWLLGNRWPQQARKNAILDVFFPFKKSNQGDLKYNYRSRMDKAWSDGQEARHIRLEKLDEDSIFKKWINTGANFETEGIARINMSDVKSNNSPEEIFRLYGDIEFNIAEIDTENGTPVYVGVRKIILSVRSDGFRTVNRTWLGQRTQISGILYKQGKLEITGPTLDASDCIVGEILNEDYLVSIEEVLSNGDGFVVVEAHAPRGSFVASRSAIPPNMSGENPNPELEAVINILIGKDRQKDAQNRLLLARDTMIRKEEE